MKNIYKCFCLFFLLTGYVQLNAHVGYSDTQNFSDASNKELDQAFIAAIRKSDLEEVKRLIEAGADVNQEITFIVYLHDWDVYETTSVLEYAARKGDQEIVKEILQLNPNIDDVNNALISAASNGDVKIINDLLNTPGINLNYEDKRGKTALIAAIEKGRLTLVNELIEAGSDINFVNKLNDTPLIIAVRDAHALSEFSNQAQCSYDSRWEQRAEIIDVLLTAQANVNDANSFGNTPLMLAIKNYDSKSVKKLLEAPGINVNHANNEGDSALIIAIKHLRTSYIVGDKQQYQTCINSQDNLEMILEFPGVNLFHINKKGDSAIEMLIELAEKEEW